jgi:hypothetical protein
MSSEQAECFSNRSNSLQFGGQVSGHGILNCTAGRRERENSTSFWGRAWQRRRSVVSRQPLF